MRASDADMNVHVLANDERCIEVLPRTCPVSTPSAKDFTLRSVLGVVANHRGSSAGRQEGQGGNLPRIDDATALHAGGGGDRDGRQVE